MGMELGDWEGYGAIGCCRTESELVEGIKHLLSWIFFNLCMAIKPSTLA